MPNSPGSALTPDRKPNFFIAGAPKCGTSALYVYLKAHPQIFMPEVKEPEYFAEDILGERRTISSWEAYQRLFENVNGETRLGEASTAYLSSPVAAHRIHAFNPSAQIIIMVRNPVDLLYAFHSQLLTNGHEKITRFSDALEADERHSPGKPGGARNRVALTYRQIASLSGQIARYFNIYGREKVRVIVFDDFKSDTEGVYKETLEFLGVGSDFRPAFEQINPNRRVRSRLIQRMLQRPPSVVRTLSHSLMPLSARIAAGAALRRLNNIVAPRPPMPPALRKKLVKEFEPEVEQLGRLLNRDFSAWVL